MQFNGGTTATVTVSINDDSQVENMERFFGKLESSGSGVQIGVDTATVNIVDNDCKFFANITQRGVAILRLVSKQ